MYIGGQPIIILQDDTVRDRGEEAFKKNIMAAKAISDAVKSTLGPKGMDKMLVEGMGGVVITNDGATILKDLDIVHPAAKMLVEVAETLDEECGDGTTSAVVLAGELLKQTEEMMGRIHTSTITKGYRMAAEKAIEVLGEMKHEFDPTDRDMLKAIARTSLTGKSVEVQSDLMEDMVVDTVLSVSEERDGVHHADLDDIKIIKIPGGTVGNSKWLRGVVVEKERGSERMPYLVNDAVVALMDTPIKIKKPEIKASIDIRDPATMKKFHDEEENRIKSMVQAVSDSGANVLFCKEEINEMAMESLARMGIMAVENVDEDDLKMISRFTGGNIVSSTKELDKENLGTAKKVVENRLSDKQYISVEGEDTKKTVSIILRGGSSHIVEEIQRDLDDALKVVAVAMEEHAVVPGGGATEIEISRRLKDYAGTIGGREQMAIEAFAEALLIIPTTIANNAGLSGLDLVMELTAVHQGGKITHGLEVFSGCLQDSLENGIVEPYKIKLQGIQSAAEAANMILRIDDVIASRGGMGLEEE